MNTTRLIECVPNFSEGRDRAVIKQITDAIESVEGVRLLDVDPGEATNRTVVTFVGDPESVQEAAFRGVRKAAELIDMSKHHGAHPRMGATDVCPLIPVSGVTLEEAAEMARDLGRRIADELNIPVYAYEASALKPGRKNLAVCRRGEYEGLAERFGGEDGPDFGNRPWHPKTKSSNRMAWILRNLSHFDFFPKNLKKGLTSRSGSDIIKAISNSRKECERRNIYLKVE